MHRHPKTTPFQWVSSDFVDLNSPDGTFVRGIVETNFLLMATHDHDVVPPGYLEATNDKRPIRELYDNDKKPGIPPGTIYFAVIRFPPILGGPTPTPAPPETSEIGRAAVCYSVDPVRFGFEPHLNFTYKRVGKAPPSDQSGPGNQPTVNVFGDWELAAYGIPNKDDRAACAKASVSEVKPLDSKPSPGWPLQAD